MGVSRPFPYQVEFQREGDDKVEEGAFVATFGDPAVCAGPQG